MGSEKLHKAEEHNLWGVCWEGLGEKLVTPFNSLSRLGLGIGLGPM